jgi:integrase
MYITEILVDGKKISTAQRRWSAILHSHRTAALPAPALEEPRAILNGAQHIRLEQPKQMAPLSIASLEKIAARLSNKTDAASARDRAIMVIGFASALRRSTLTALLLSDIEFTSDGLIVNVRKEKQDQKGKGRLIGLPHGEKKITCPVASVRSWLHHRGERAGPLFTRLDRAAPGKRLHPGAIAGVVKSCVSKIGLDPRKYAGHSLRAGFITEAGEAGIGELIIAAQTGHRSMEVLRRYFRRTELFKANAAGMIGL